MPFFRLNYIFSRNPAYIFFKIGVSICPKSTKHNHFSNFQRIDFIIIRTLYAAQLPHPYIFPNFQISPIFPIDNPIKLCYNPINYFSTA